MKVSLFLIMVAGFLLSACNKGSVAPARVPEKSFDTKAEFSLKDCPHIVDGKYKNMAAPTANKARSNRRQLQLNYSMKKSEDNIVYNLAAEFPYTVDGVTHQQDLPDGGKISYQGWCSEGQLTVQFFADGSYLGNEKVKSLNNTDIRVQTDIHFRGEANVNDVIYRRQ